MSVYIQAADVTDTIVENIELSGFLTRADNEIITLARSMGVDSASIKTPIDYVISRWAAAWVTWNVCLEKIGRTNIDETTKDKYAVKYEVYYAIMKDYQKQITKEMFLGQTSGALNNMPRGIEIVRGS